MTLNKKRWKKFGKYLGLLSLILAVGLFIVLEVLSRGAAAIFNEAMENQDMLRGTVTVEKLLAHVNGKVQFENLEWKDTRGNTLLLVPRGSFQVRLWDAIRQDFSAKSIESLTLEEAQVSLHLSDDMQVDFIRPTRDAKKIGDKEKDWRETVSFKGRSEEERRKISEWRRERRTKKLTKNWQNFNREGKRVKMKLALENCRLEVFYRHRHYLMDEVTLHTAIDTNRAMTLDLSTGGFGGDMIGNGVKIKGGLDFRSGEVPQLQDMRVAFQEVEPSSLGLGLNIKDPMTLDVKLNGPVTDFRGEGTVELLELHIPALDFTNVLGKLAYNGHTLDFSEVEANVYGGTLTADGSYDLDTRYYHIEGVGMGLKTQKALPGSHLKCDVDMNLSIDAKGSAKETVVSGSFRSGPGRYRILPFEELSGKFSDAYHDLAFSDVTIRLAGVTAETDAFRIKEGKLTMEPIELKDAWGRNLATVDLER